MKAQTYLELDGYCRLSRDDNNGSSESMSIANQKKLLTSYAEERGWKIRRFYVDDGHSGTTFERPAFQEMIRDIERGIVDCIITKDLSRLGRNYVMVGQYTEFYFPQKGVRFIAINDGVDTNQGDNEIAPFKNILNEMYAKDISKKVRSMRVNCAKEGKFMGSKPPFGYLKSPADKHVLIVDEDVRDTVQRMFRLFAEGESARHIAEIFNGERILSPRAYYYKQLGRPNPNPSESMTWNSNTVRQLLDNQVYIGHMVQGKRAAFSFKSKKRVFKDKADWIVIEDTHEALIDCQTWAVVQKRFAETSTSRSRVTKDGELALFSGLLRCADCGGCLAFSSKETGTKKYRYYRCSKFAVHGKKVCTQHTIQESELAQWVTNDIQMNARLAQEERLRLEEQIKRLRTSEQKMQLESSTLKLRESEKRSAALDDMIQKLFEERFAGNVPDTIFKKLMHDYEDEQNKLEKTIAGHKETISYTQQEQNDVGVWLDMLSAYADIKALDRSTVVNLIDSITVSEQYEVNGKKTRDIQIRYKFVGALDDLASRSLA